MAEVLKGRRELFKGLWIDSSGYDFKPYPVVKLTMTGECDTEEQLKSSILTELELAARENGVELAKDKSPGDTLKLMISDLKTRTKERVAVLIDEYDAPIQAQIADISKANINRQVLHDFYSALKASQDRGMLQVLFVTGVTKFAQASIFSVFNILADLTLEADYNGVCGFTMEEFDAYFAEYLPGILEYQKSKGRFGPSASDLDLKSKIMDYYDGYSWDGERRVLNPYSLIKFLQGKRFKPFWFSTGTPTFLVDFIERAPLDYVQSESQILTDSNLEAVKLEDLELTPSPFPDRLSNN
jgi:hypothetical protein